MVCCLFADYMESRLPMNETALYSLIVLVALCLVLLLIHLFRQSRQSGLNDALPELQRELADAMQAINERTERQLREQVLSSAQGTRQELAATLLQFQQGVTQQMTSVSTIQSDQMRGFAEQLARLAATNNEQLEKMREGIALQSQHARAEQAEAMKRFSDTLHQTLTTLTESNTKRMAEVRGVLEEKIRELQSDNAKKLEEMRQTVDEKLHATLEQRLGESFKQVSERLEKVHQGLGEMHQLAMGVGDLKRVLTNVKTRGTWGEVQLEMLLEQLMTPEQYAKNVETVPGSGAVVEFAIKLPGKDDANSTVYLPIDAKFPKDVYEQYYDAFEAGDAALMESCGRQLETTIKKMAKDIHDKYVDPPFTTDFAILFLPFESIYAEVIRRTSLVETLQKDYKIVVTGPTTLGAILNSLQMGFRTLAIQKRTGEVWTVLGAVKTEFGKFGGLLEKVQKNLQSAGDQLEEVMGKRTRAIERKLRQVEELPHEESRRILPIDDGGEDD